MIYTKKKFKTAHCRPPDTHFLIFFVYNRKQENKITKTGLKSSINASHNSKGA